MVSLMQTKIHERPSTAQQWNIAYLSSCTPRSHCGHSKVLRVNLHIDFVTFGHNGNSRRRSMDSSLRFRCRNPLHSMDPSFPLHFGIYFVAFDFNDDIFKTTVISGRLVNDGRLPTHGANVLAIDVQQISCHKNQIWERDKIKQVEQIDTQNSTVFFRQ